MIRFKFYIVSEKQGKNQRKSLYPLHNAKKKLKLTENYSKTKHPK